MVSLSAQFAEKRNHLIESNSLMNCFNIFFLGGGGGGIHTQGGGGGTAPRCRRVYALLDNVRYLFLIIHNTLSQCKCAYSGSRLIKFSLCVVHAVSK